MLQPLVVWFMTILIEKGNLLFSSQWGKKGTSVILSTIKIKKKKKKTVLRPTPFGKPGECSFGSLRHSLLLLLPVRTRNHLQTSEKVVLGNRID